MSDVTWKKMTPTILITIPKMIVMGMAETHQTENRKSPNARRGLKNKIRDKILTEIS
jgi:hypothetical protein